MSDGRGKRSATGWVLIAAEVLLVLLVLRWFVQNRAADQPEDGASATPRTTTVLPQVAPDADRP